MTRVAEDRSFLASHRSSRSVFACRLRLLSRLAAGVLLAQGLSIHGSHAADPAGAGGRRPDSQVYFERPGLLAFERARESFESGRAAEGVSRLQEVLNRPFDCFVPWGSTQFGVRAAAESLLADMPVSARRFYQTTQSASASAKLAEAIAARDRSLLGEVVRRFPSTDAAFRATDRLAGLAFDRGDFGTAARLWDDLLSNPRHAERLTPALVAKTVVALHRVGRDGRASELAARFAATPLRVDERPATIGTLLRQIELWEPPVATTGRPGTAAAGLSPPAFPPAWHQPVDAADLGLTELWAAARRSEGRPVATPAGATITDGRLIVHSAAEVVAYDLESGERAWRVPLSGSMVASAGSRSEDLRELERFEELYAGNSSRAAITSDGDRLYLVEESVERRRGVRTASASPVPVYDLHPATDRADRLIALPVVRNPETEDRPVWVAGGSGQGADGIGLAGHHFFGPPVVAEGCLLSVTEYRQCLNLVALKPASGERLWQQPLGFVPRPVGSDRMRAAADCRPAIANGIAVCGTNTGFAVAVDIITGRLMWAYEYAASEPGPAGSGQGRAEPSAYHGDPAFASPVVVRGDSVVLLPRDSQRIHCLDLATGTLKWTAPRDDALQVAAVTETSVIMLGRSSCRSLALENGGPLWSARLGMPAGSGVVTDSTYLLPLDSGSIVGIDLATGRQVGFDTPRDAVDFRPLDADASTSDGLPRWRPGNLYTDGRSLFSVGPFGVTRLETAGTLLADAGGSEDILETARIELAAGRFHSARPKLAALVADQATQEPRRSEARRLLRELHYLDLERGDAAEHESTLAKLDRLSRSPSERARFLLKAIEHELRGEDAAEVGRRLGELAAIDPAVLLPAPGDPMHLITAVSGITSMLDRLSDDSLTVSLPDLSPAEATDAELRRRLLLQGDGSAAAEIRLELARRAADDGEFHRAELLCLRAGRQDEFDAAAEREYDRLRDHCKLTEAGSEPCSLTDGVGHVHVTQELWSPADDGLCRTFGRSRRGFLTPGLHPFRIVDVGDSRRSRLAFVNLERGVPIGEVALDARLRFPSPGMQPQRSHFVPVATAERVYGLSLLEARRGEPVWTAELPGDDRMLPRIGPYDASFCVIQTRHELIVLDPATGDPLWQRVQLPAGSGLNADIKVGLFGDEEVLVSLGADGASYTVYRTLTGEEISRGRLPIDLRRQPRAFGRKLFFVETGEDKSTARLWDPLTGEYELDTPFDGRLSQASTREDDLVLLFENGRLLIFDPRSARTVIDVRIDPARVAVTHTIQVFSDAERYYVSLYQADPDRFEEPRIAKSVYDTPLTMNHVQGRLLAIDRRTGAVVWSRPTERRSILDPVETPLPFLVAVARVEEGASGRRKTLLVEAIDRQTGAILGRNDALLYDHLLQVRYAAEADRIELAGMTSTVVLEFGRRVPDRALVAHRPGDERKMP